MSEHLSVTVTVPATTANLGAGFDCIGAALSLYNEFTFSFSDSETQIYVTGAEAERVATDKSNLLYQGFSYLYQQLQQTPPPVEIQIKLGIPLARGLGSSATAIVAGLLGANVLLGKPFSQTEIMNFAIAMEGHPDNVVPALIGGCRLAATSVFGWEICDIPWSDAIIPVVAIPDFELSTSTARQVLPTNIHRADAIFNIAHLGLLIRGLETANPAWISTALDDKLHQPYRKSLIHGYPEVEQAVKAAGGYGMVISGAGPTLLALTDPHHAQDVAVAMATSWQQQGIKTSVHTLTIDHVGAKIVCTGMG